MTATQYKEIFNELLRVSEESRKLIPLVTEATESGNTFKAMELQRKVAEFQGCAAGLLFALNALDCIPKEMQDLLNEISI